MINGNNGSVGVAFPLRNRLDLLIDQIGILTELVTTGFSELKTIAQAQQQDINRLVEVADRQSETVAKQAQTVDRLALMLERVLSNSR